MQDGWLKTNNSNNNKAVWQFVFRIKNFKIFSVVQGPKEYLIRASPTVLGMWSCTVKLAEQYPTYAVWLRKLVSAEHMLAWLVDGASALCPSRKECNKYDLTATPCFWLVYHNDWSRWFVSSSPPTHLLSPFQFYGWGCKTVQN